MIGILSLTFFVLYILTQDPINLYGSIGFGLTAGLFDIAKALREKNRAS